MNRQELVEKMQKAWELAPLMGADSNQVAMDRALSVAIDELLGEPSEDEIISTARQGVNWAFGKGLDYDRVRDIFAARRAKIERVKTPEERVTVESRNGCKGIYLDGVRQVNLSDPKDVERYRLGLIQQLKDAVK